MATVIEPKVKITLAEFAEMDPPEDAGYTLDLIDGEIIKREKPNFEEKAFVLSLAVPIASHVYERRLGQVSGDVFILYEPDGDRSHTPDIIFLATEHLDRIRDGKVCGAPDLVVTVLSTHTRSDAYGINFLTYQQGGIPWYWIVDPVSFLIEEYRHTPDGYLRSQTILRGQTFRPGLFPELEINLEAIPSG